MKQRSDMIIIQIALEEKPDLAHIVFADGLLYGQSQSTEQTEKKDQ